MSDAPEPEPPAPPARSLRPLCACIFAALVFVLVGVAIGLHLRPERTPLRTGAGYARLHAALLELLEDADDLPPPPPSDVTLHELAARHPDVERDHAPFRPTAGDDVHAVFASFVERAGPLAPDWVVDLGVHPHPGELTSLSEEATLRWLLLCRDARAALMALDAGRLEPHDRIDHAVFLGQLDLQLRWASNDHDVLTWIDTWNRNTQLLAVVECCPEPERRAAIIARLRALPARLAEARAALARPSRAEVASLIRSLTEDPKRPIIDTTDPHPELVAADAAARAELRAFAEFLRTEVLPRADGPLGMGPENLALTLERGHHLPGGVEGALRAALEELDATRRVFVRADRRAERTDDPLPEYSARHPQARIELLADRVPSWIDGPPADPGVRLAPMPLAWRGGAEAYYVDAGAFGPHVPAWVLWDPPAPESDEEQRLLASIRLDHVLAHESYPGHHLQSVMAHASSCQLRRAYADALLVEGWAVLAEDLVHDRCVRDPLHGWSAAYDDVDSACSGALDLAIQARLVDAEQLLEWQGPEAELAHAGDLALSNGYFSSYVLGPRELRKLRERARARFPAWSDARFHTELLRAGPIPVPLIGEELFGR